MSDFITPFWFKQDGWSEDKWVQYDKIIDSFDFYNVPIEEEQWILQALHDDETWDWYEECDGATCVSEPGWPVSPVKDVAFMPPYVYHDYAWTKWGATWKSNYRMWRLQNTYKMERLRSGIRWIGVTCFGMPVNWIMGLFK